MILLMKIIGATFISLFLVGCGTNKQIVLKDVKKIESKSNIEKINNILLKTNPDYAKKYQKKSLIENEALDFNRTKPFYKEPLFVKIHFTPYKTNKNIHHEKKSVWIEVEEGNMALIINKKNDNKNINSILNK